MSAKKQHRNHKKKKIERASLSNEFTIEITDQQTQWLNNINKRIYDTKTSEIYKKDISFLRDVMIYKQNQKIHEYLDEITLYIVLVEELKNEAKKCLEDYDLQTEHINTIKKLMDLGYKKNENKNKLIIEQKAYIDKLEKQINTTEKPEVIIEQTFEKAVLIEQTAETRKLEESDLISPKKPFHNNCKCFECDIENISNQLKYICEDLECEKITEKEAIQDIIYYMNQSLFMKKILTKENSTIIQYYRNRIIQLKKKIQELKS